MSKEQGDAGERQARASPGGDPDAPAATLQRLPAAGTIRVSPATRIPALLEEFGCDPVATLAGSGISLKLLEQPDSTIPFEALGRLVARCVDITRCAHFGLLIGMRCDVTVLGALGFLIRNAPDIGSALRDLTTNLDLHSRGAVPRLVVSKHSAVLSYSIYLRDSPGVDQIYDGCVAVMCNIMRGLCGPSWIPSEVMLPHRPPADVSPFVQFFRAPVRFNSEEASIAFPAFWLDRKVPHADADLHAFIRTHLPVRSSPDELKLSERIRSVMRTQLLGGGLSADGIAKQFGMHRRSLDRRLQEEGRTIHEIMDEVRFDIARHLMRDTAIPLRQIAHALGFSEASSFTRAFRRWSGVAPAQWRNGRTAGRENEH